VVEVELPSVAAGVIVDSFSTPPVIAIGYQVTVVLLSGEIVLVPPDVSVVAADPVG
jgi:hypothetical protein